MIKSVNGSKIGLFTGGETQCISIRVHLGIDVSGSMSNCLQGSAVAAAASSIVSPIHWALYWPPLVRSSR